MVSESSQISVTATHYVFRPSNVSNLQAQLAQNASSKNIKVLPLLVPPEEIKLEHLRYLYANRRIGAQNDTLDNLLQFKDGLPVETNLSGMNDLLPSLPSCLF